MTEPSEPMLAAIAAAVNARGRTSPNPWVGAVLVRAGRIIASGATAPFGGSHAEAAVLEKGDGHGATLYTTLEPCMPYEGKKTPPCVEAIVAAGITKVVIGIEDSHDPVRGRGVAYLRRHGIEVEVGDGAAAVTALLRPYLKFRATGRPYVIAKFAVSLDGKVGAPAAGVRWLTGELARERVHADRAWVDAVMVGSGTVLTDNPALTARPGGIESERQPLRIVLDGRGLSPASAEVFGPRTIVATANSSREWRTAIAATGATLIELERGERGVNLDQLFRVLGQRNVMSLIAEGGPTLLESLFEAGHVDEVHAYSAPVVLGAAGIPLFPDGGKFEPAMLRDTITELLHPDVLIRGYTGTWSPEGA